MLSTTTPTPPTLLSPSCPLLGRSTNRPLLFSFGAATFDGAKFRFPGGAGDRFAFLDTQSRSKVFEFHSDETPSVSGYFLLVKRWISRSHREDLDLGGGKFAASSPSFLWLFRLPSLISMDDSWRSGGEEVRR
jgi:hypothetical protein